MLEIIYLSKLLQLIDFIKKIIKYKSDSMKCTQNTNYHTCMSIHHQCCSGQKTQQQPFLQNTHRQYEKQFAQILENQLKSLNDAKQVEIDSLQNQISKLRSQLMKLQYRNQLDKQNQNTLEKRVIEQARVINQLKDAIHNLQRKNQIKNQEKNVNTVESKQDYGIGNSNYKKKIEEIEKQNSKLREQQALLNGKLAEKQKYYNCLEQTLRSDIIRAGSNNRDLNDEIDRLGELLDLKEKQILSLQQNNTYLEEKIEIISMKSTRQPQDPLIIHKIQHEPPKISEVYIDRPVQKIVYIERQKLIKEFIQPDRPIVTRVINCGPQKSKCGCQSEDNSYYEKKNNYEKESYEKNIGEYQNVIQKYKGQRDQLVNQIRNRNSDITLLQRKVQLCQKSQNFNNNRKTYDVDVTVFKNNQEILNSEQPSNPNKKDKITSKIPQKKTQVPSKNVVSSTKRR